MDCYRFSKKKELILGNKKTFRKTQLFQEIKKHFSIYIFFGGLFFSVARITLFSNESSFFYLVAPITFSRNWFFFYFFALINFSKIGSMFFLYVFSRPLLLDFGFFLSKTEKLNIVA